jgi:choline dehydrogenase
MLSHGRVMYWTHDEAAHHAMITVYPDPSDWDHIAGLTNDPSWGSENMWRYFERCTDEHGFGWLTIEAAGVSTALSAATDQAVRDIVFAAVKHAPHLAQGLVDAVLHGIGDIFTASPQTVFGDTNHLRQIMGDREGLYRIPLSTKNGTRNGVTEFILSTNHHPDYHDNLTIWTDALATKVKFENGRAASVEYLRKKGAYRADRDPARGDRRDWAEAAKELQTISATKEIILAAGAFNTPQLLMNSGIGPLEHLTAKGVQGAFLDLPGVGANLQDRYEIPVIDNLDHEFSLLDGYTFRGDSDDKGSHTWKTEKTGFYTTNGGTIAIIRRSGATAGPNCDLFIFGIPGEFAGYQLDYSKRIRNPEGRSRFSWSFLKPTPTIKARSG